MNLTSLYYEMKPVLPRRVRSFLRRRLIDRQYRLHRETWPIYPFAGRAPKDWAGWPEGKSFAFVLTHDVESDRGVARCPAVAALDAKHGFRAGYYFVPEGYDTPDALRGDLVDQGCEIGVHGLRHDGKLFKNRRTFSERARRINHWLREWNAVGFRAPFMHHNLNWFHDLDIEYDASTFDYDPFEPQPDGVDTIFPFSAVGSVPGRGYVELPYTLPQDSTVFLYMGHRTIDIWKRKLDWLAEQGGVAMVTIHPDYVACSGDAVADNEFPVALYEEFLAYVRERYAGAYWHVVPRDLARFWKGSGSPVPVKTLPRHKVWIDLDNTPHVPFFQPIKAELSRRNLDVMLSARDSYQVHDLARRLGMNCQSIGSHYGRSRLLKVLGVLLRSVQLAPFALRHRPALGLSHGSRSQTLLCNLLRIPTVLLFDYEHSRSLPFCRPTWRIVPDVISDEVLQFGKGHGLKYSGIKEDVYVPFFRPNGDLRKELGLGESSIVVTVRPPATEAHYHNPEGEILFSASMKRLLGHENVIIVLLPRNERQEVWIRESWPEWFAQDRVIIPERAVEGLNLLWHSDLVISGGGTMNREAAALGIPVYSIFRGKMGMLDQHLEKEHRLVLVQSEQDVTDLIRIEKRGPVDLGRESGPTLDQIIGHIQDVLKVQAGVK